MHTWLHFAQNHPDIPGNVLCLTPYQTELAYDAKCSLSLYLKRRRDIFIYSDCTFMYNEDLHFKVRVSNFTS